jgi:hypothetical protein
MQAGYHGRESEGKGGRGDSDRREGEQKKRMEK